MAAAIILGTALNLMAGFAEDFQAARKLFDGKAPQAAHEAFAQLAEAAPNAHGKAASLSYAARALGRRQQYGQAIELAKTIDAAPMSAYTQMAIMAAGRKHGELVAAFREEDIAAWPDRINYRGFFLRGGAFSAEGDRQAAVKDFEQCVELAGSDAWVKLEALNNAAALHHVLGDDAKAMDVYRQAFAVYDESPNRKGRWLYPKALLGAAQILTGQGKHDEARAILAKFSVKPEADQRGPWDFLVLEAVGDIHAARGERDAALAKYREAVGIDTHRSYVDRVEKKIEDLSTGKADEAK